MDNRIFLLVNPTDEQRSAWEPYGRTVEVALGEPILSDLELWLSSASTHFGVGPYWVVFIERGELPEGNPALASEFFKQAEEKILSEGVTQPVHFALQINGYDWSPNSLVERIFYVPEGKRWADEWEWIFSVGTRARPVRYDVKTTIALFPTAAISLNDTMSIYQSPKKEQREAFFAALEWDQLSPGERSHYAAERKRQEATTRPLLSLCVMTRELDYGFFKMLESAQGQFDEYVIMATGPVDWAELPVLDAPTTIEDYRCPEEIKLSDDTPCIGNFGRAREHCFNLAKGTWRMFLDADDTLEWTGAPPPGNLRKALIKQMSTANRVALPYYYSPNIVQTRMCIWRWLDEKGNRLWRWDGAPVHERVEPTEHNDGERTYHLELPGEIFVIRHHGNDDAVTEAHLERNYRIAANALLEGDWPAHIAARLLYTAAIYEMAHNIPRGEQTLRALPGEFPREPYALIGAIDLARHLNATGRWREVAPLLMPLQEVWSDEPELFLHLARAKVFGGQEDIAARWFMRCYAPRGEDRLEYRKMRGELELDGRLEAAEVFCHVGMWNAAVQVLEQTPKDLQETKNWARTYHTVQVERSKHLASMGGETLIHYLISLDQVDKAQEVYAALPHELREKDGIGRLSRALELRLRHINEPEEYLETYGQLNATDLTISARAHLPRILEGVIEENPDIFVDVGCNTGWLALQVAKALPQCQVLGLDAGALRVEEARSRAEKRGLGNARFEVCLDGDWRQFFPNTYQGRVVVSCSEVLEHVPDAQEFFETISSGSSALFVTVPDSETYHNLVTRARRLDLPLSESAVTSQHGGEHVRCFDAHSLVELAHASMRDTARVYRSPLTSEGDMNLLFAKFTFGAHHKRDLGRVDIVAEGFVPWGPRAHETGHIGGSEQAVIHLAPRLSALGYEVHVYADPITQLEYDEGVWWHRVGEFRPEQGPKAAVIVWRRPQRLRDYQDQARGRWPVLLWCHDTPEVENVSHAKLADSTITLSHYQRELFASCGVERFAVLQNGVVREEIEAVLAKGIERNEKRIFYGSSVDRGLLGILRAWPAIRESHPTAELVATYRRDLLRHYMAGDIKERVARDVEQLAEEYKDQGVTLYDGLKHRDYLELAASCGVWAYPSHFPEISCIVAMEMQALGLQPVATDYAALAETILWDAIPARCRVPWDTYQAEIVERGAQFGGGTWWLPHGCYSPWFVAALNTALGRPLPEEPRSKLQADALALYDWNRTAELFRDTIEGVRDGNQQRRQGVEK